MRCQDNDVPQQQHRRMEVLGSAGLQDYYNILAADTSGQELSELLNLLTTTETYFFRNTQQFVSN